jgi:hypothetical protein
MPDVRRRELMAVLSGAAAWPSAARAQQPERVRRIGVLIGLAESDSDVARYLNELRETLRSLGWIEGKNLRVDHRAAADLAGMRSHALELANLGAELVVTYSTPATTAVRHAARGVPIVFTAVSDPIGTGFVAGLSRPSGVITGFTNFEPSMGSKWLELMHDTSPSIKRAAILFNPTTANTGASGGIYLPSMQAAAQVLEVQLTPSPVSDPGEIDDLCRAGTGAARRRDSHAERLHVYASATYRCASGTVPHPDRLPAFGVRHGRRASVLRDRLSRPDPTRGVIRRPNLAWHQARRSTRATTDQVRAGHQRQDRQGARPRSASHASRPRPTR